MNVAVSLVGAIVALYAVQVWTANDSVRHGPTALHAVLMLVTGIAQSGALFALLRGEKWTRTAGAAVAVAAVAMLALSFACTNTDDDAAAYVGYAKLATAAQAYRPPAVAYSGNGFEIVRATWPVQPPLVYGPLWLAVDRALVGPAPTYAFALALLRGENVVLLCGLVLALRALGLRARALAIVAINPMLWFFFVVQAHNDLLAIVPVIAGAAIARRRPLLGALVAGIAGLVKITFVAIAVAAYAGRRGWRATLGSFVLSTAAVVAVSALAGGTPYLHAMLAVGHEQIATRTDAVHVAGVLLHAALGAVAVAALALAAGRGAFLPAASYAFGAISTIVYPWYLGWCIPYAARIPAFAGLFFASLPAISHAIDPHFSLFPNRTFAAVDAYYLAVLVAVAIAWRSRPTPAH